MMTATSRRYAATSESQAAVSELELLVSDTALMKASYEGFVDSIMVAHCGAGGVDEVGPFERRSASVLP